VNTGLGISVKLRLRRVVGSGKVLLDRPKTDEAKVMKEFKDWLCAFADVAGNTLRSIGLVAWDLNEEEMIIDVTNRGDVEGGV
jgi:hypothetical protein